VEGVVGVQSCLFGDVYRGRRVFVTGHTGFKGAWLTQWLLELGADVTGYALEPPTQPSLFDELGLSARIDHHIGDIRDLAHLREVMEAAGPEVVFHLAAQPLVRLSYETPVETFATNVMGTVNVLEAARSLPDLRAMVVVTSDKCYENRETGQAYTETDAMGGYDPYSASKGCAELVTSAYRRSFFGPGSSVRIASVRAGNVIGGGDWAQDRIVPDCVRALEAGEPIIIRNPDATRPFQHVLEPLSGYLWLGSLLWSGGPEFEGAWNFGPEEQGVVSVRHIADAMVRNWGSGSWSSPDGRSHDVHEAHLLALDISKAVERLKWHPLYEIDRTLTETLSWYRARFEGADVRAITDSNLHAYVDEGRARGAVWAMDESD